MRKISVVNAMFVSTKISIDPTAPFDAHQFFKVLRAAGQNPRLQKVGNGPVMFSRDVYDCDHELALQAFAWTSAMDPKNELQKAYCDSIQFPVSHEPNMLVIELG